MKSIYLLLIGSLIAISSLSANARPLRTTISYWNGTYDCGGQITKLYNNAVSFDGVRAPDYHIYCAGDGSGCSLYQLSYKMASCYRIDHKTDYEQEAQESDDSELIQLTSTASSRGRVKRSCYPTGYTCWGLYCRQCCNPPGGITSLLYYRCR